MCGIFGYLGTKQASEQYSTRFRKSGYFGYDSWGIAVSDGASIEIVKSSWKCAETAGKSADVGWPSWPGAYSMGDQWGVTPKMPIRTEQNRVDLP